MIIRISIAAAIVLISFSAGAGIFRGSLAGVVLDERSNAEISGVAISLKVKGNLITNHIKTGSNGQFDLDLKNIFPKVSFNRRTIELTFKKEGYNQAVIVLNTDSDKETWDHQVVQLTKLREIEKLPKELRDKIDKYLNEKGKTLYLFPHYLTEANESLKPIIFAQNLLDNISASLRTTVQAAPGAEMDVSIQTISDMDIAPANIERHYQIGDALNALATISGIGELSADEQGQQEIYLKSNYVTIPNTPGLQPGYVTIKDQFPARLLNSIQLSEYLNRVWGHRTSLALCIQEFRRAMAMTPSKSRARLEEIEELIVAYRSQLSADDKELDGQFERLLNIVIKELN